MNKANIQKEVPEGAICVGYVGPNLPIDEFHGDFVCVPVDGGGFHLYKEVKKK